MCRLLTGEIKAYEDNQTGSPKLEIGMDPSRSEYRTRVSCQKTSGMICVLQADVQYEPSNSNGDWKMILGVGKHRDHG